MEVLLQGSLKAFDDQNDQKLAGQPHNILGQDTNEKPMVALRKFNTEFF